MSEEKDKPESEARIRAKTLARNIPTWQTNPAELYTWDYVMVFKVRPLGQFADYRHRLTKHIHLSRFLSLVCCALAFFDI
jgi:hypothetical protein